MCVYHDAEVSALVTSFCWEQGSVVQKLLQQFSGFGHMFLVMAELALASHTQQSVHLTLVTCRQVKVCYMQRSHGTDFDGGGGGGRWVSPSWRRIFFHRERTSLRA